MPVAFVNLCDGNGGQSKVISDEDKALTCFGIDETNAAQLFGVVSLALGGFQTDALVTAKPCCFVDGTGLADIECHVAFGTRYEESSRLMDAVKPGKIDISTIHDIDTFRLKSDLIENIHIVDTSICNNDKCWDRALQID